jgi:hypothetical protein
MLLRAEPGNRDCHLFRGSGVENLLSGRYLRSRGKNNNVQTRACQYTYCPGPCSYRHGYCVQFGLHVISAIVNDDHSADYPHSTGRAHGRFDGESDQRCQRQLVCAELELGKCNLMCSIGRLERFPTDDRQRIDRRTQHKLQLHTDLYRPRRVGCRNCDDNCDGPSAAAATSTVGEFSGNSHGRYERGYFRAQLELN